MDDKKKADEAAKAAAKKKAEDEESLKKVCDAEVVLKKCLDAYGIPEDQVFAGSVKNGVATVVTNGGARVRLGEGDDPKKAEKLSEIAITGINPEWKKQRIVAGKKRG